MFIEVENNPNCGDSVFARFKEIGPARRVIQVKSFERSAQGEWCWVTGWSDDPEHPCGPAFAQPVEDSGAGITHLVFGGPWGVRLKPVSLDEEWNLESRNQWGEPYLSLADPKDLVHEGA
jgi:hypothetical protein